MGAAAASAATTAAGASTADTDAGVGSSQQLARYAFYTAWGLITVVFACAYWQGADFASTKDSATVWGAIIGLAAFFAWLAVDDDEAEKEGESPVGQSSMLKKTE